MTVRIQDVARAAGVSPATVSRVLNNNLTVDPDLARRVRDAAFSLHYRPNAAARSLRRRRGRVWALLVTDVTKPSCTTVARGVEDVAQEHGYSVLLCNTDEVVGKEARYLEIAEEERAAGVIIAPVSANTSNIARLIAADIPVVVIGRRLDTPVDHVRTASFEGARTATEHLLRMGWTRPACITGPAHAEPSTERQKGYASAVTDSCLPNITQSVDSHTDDGRNAIGHLLDLSVPPDSLVVANSVLALGVLHELKHRDLTPGQDIGLVTFGDAAWAQVMSPTISAVVQPTYEMGAQAATMLAARISDRAPRRPRTVILRTNLIERESSRRS